MLEEGGQRIAREVGATGRAAAAAVDLDPRQLDARQVGTGRGEGLDAGVAQEAVVVRAVADVVVFEEEVSEVLADERAEARQVVYVVAGENGC